MQNLLDVTVVVPTNRSLLHVEKSLLNIRQIALAMNAKLVVSDNRGDAAKTARLSAEFGESYYISPEQEASGNFDFALSKVSSRFLWALHDDDWVFDLGGKIPTQLPPGFVGICPTIILSSPATGIYGIRNFDLCHDDPLTRLRNYGAQSGGANSILFTIWETDLLRNIAATAIFHPCPAGYQDWAIGQAMLAEGKVISTDKFGYRYNNNNWFGPPAAIQEEIENLMRRADLPLELAGHMTELRVLDLVAFFGRKVGYHLSLQDRYSILHNIASDFFANYQPDRLPTYISQILETIRKIDPVTGDRYQTYLEKALGGNSIGAA